MRVSYAPGYQAPIPTNHIFPMGKFKGLYEYLTDQRLLKQSQVIRPKPVEKNLLQRVHTSRYTDAILHGMLNRKEERLLGLPWSSGLALRSTLAVQGTINAAIMALEDGISGNLAGGTHHSMPDHGEGFCVFNDVAVAIKVLKESMWVRRVLVIDCDVHQGNGTASIFAHDDEVFTFSIHGEKNYPFKKRESSLDIGLPDATGDDEYLEILDRALTDIFGKITPDLVFYLGGIDPLETDHFGRLSLTSKGLQKREEMVISRVIRLDFPLVLLLSGGYAPTLRQTVEAHALMYKFALQQIT